MEHAQLQPGVICTWTFRTMVKYSIGLYFNDVELGDMESVECDDTYLDISDVGRVCNVKGKDTFKRTNLQTVKLTLHSGEKLTGRGFSITTGSGVRLPGPPTHILLRTYDHAIFVNWEPPREVTLAITAYNIRYGVVSPKQQYVVTVAQEMRTFAINTDTFEGKLMTVQLVAAIGREEGSHSETYFIRARKFTEYVRLLSLAVYKRIV